MLRKFMLPALACLGIGGALFVLLKNQPAQSISTPLAEPARAPYQAYVSGSGLIESPTTNVSVATAATGIVTAVHVKVGQQVKRGQPLFDLDNQAKQAEINRQRAAIQSARLKLNKSTQGTRPEEITSQQAQVAQAQVSLDEALKQLALRENIGDPRAVSRDEILQQQASVKLKQEQLRYATNQLQLLKAGTWQPDIEIAKAEIDSAELQLRQLEVDLSKLTVRAPLDGEILQVNIHPGEMASSNSNTALILMGETRSLHVRCEVDENDAWRIQPGARATAYPRGRRDVSIPLQFVRIEPYVGAKRNLSGESTERVDTRVLPVLYQFSNPSIRLYIGQQLDVFIEANPLPDPAAPATKDPKKS
jgi:HlyD family secretion protein